MYQLDVAAVSFTIIIFGEVDNPCLTVAVEPDAVKETIENAKKAAPSKSEEKPDIVETKVNEATSKTIQEIDREKLDAKFSKKDKEKLN